MDTRLSPLGNTFLNMASGNSSVPERGVWVYGDQSSYEIEFKGGSVIFKGARGNSILDRGSEWLEGDTQAGRIRLKLTSDGKMISNLKTCEQSPWGENVLASRVPSFQTPNAQRRAHSIPNYIQWRLRMLYDPDALGSVDCERSDELGDGSAVDEATVASDTVSDVQTVTSAEHYAQRRRTRTNGHGHRDRSTFRTWAGYVDSNTDISNASMHQHTSDLMGSTMKSKVSEKEMYSLPAHLANGFSASRMTDATLEPTCTSASSDACMYRCPSVAIENTLTPKASDKGVCPLLSHRNEVPPAALRMQEGMLETNCTSDNSMAFRLKPTSTKDDDTLDAVTTLMIRNLPLCMKQSDLLRELDDDGFKDLYDFCYMPCSFKDGFGKGYAFVNFRAAEHGSLFVLQWHRSHRFGITLTDAGLSVRPASLQGLEANLQKWNIPRLSRIRNPNLRPFVTRYERQQSSQELNANTTLPELAPFRQTPKQEHIGSKDGEQQAISLSQVGNDISSSVPNSLQARRMDQVVEQEASQPQSWPFPRVPGIQLQFSFPMLLGTFPTTSMQKPSF